MNVALDAAAYRRPLAPVAASEAARVARIAIFDNFSDAEAAWRRLEGKEAVYSPYQRFDWVSLWHRHVSQHRGTLPLLVTGFDALGEPLFLWPFARDRLGPLNVAFYFGDKHATINMALWRCDFAAGLNASGLRSILDRVAQEKTGVDLLMLFNQPASWNGIDNPFALLPHARAGEDNFCLSMNGPGQDILATQLSGSMRSRLRNKERKLERLDGYRYVLATAPAEVDRFLDGFFRQKAAKLKAIGVPNVFAEPGIEAFLRASCHCGLASGSPLIELHALEGDGELLALFSGLHDGRRFTSNFNSHTLSEHSRFSPGLILLQHLIARCADRGFEKFDIGPGEAAYKSFFCREFEPIFDSILPLSARGKMAVLPMRAARRLKTEIKRSPLLWPLATVLRGLLQKPAS
jgi:CelD/BcsL family acetyltransferase involved in cellulose biosynthesis